ncbi:MAG: hypothetical protein WBP81_16915 [Solirubrobacteraceae bacterium]
MRELTIHELDAELAEQLPARELMGSCGHRSGNTAVAGNSQVGLVNLGNTQLNILSAGNSNGNFAYAG